MVEEKAIKLEKKTASGGGAAVLTGREVRKSAVVSWRVSEKKEKTVDGDNLKAVESKPADQAPEAGEAVTFKDQLKAHFKARWVKAGEARDLTQEEMALVDSLAGVLAVDDLTSDRESQIFQALTQSQIATLINKVSMTDHENRCLWYNAASFTETQLQSALSRYLAKFAFNSEQRLAFVLSYAADEIRKRLTDFDFLRGLTSNRLLGVKRLMEQGDEAGKIDYLEFLTEAQLKLNQVRSIQISLRQFMPQ